MCDSFAFKLDVMGLSLRKRNGSFSYHFIGEEQIEDIPSLIQAFEHDVGDFTARIYRNSNEYLKREHQREHLE